MVLSRTDLISALAIGDYDCVLGTPEGQWLDFKSQPYALAVADGRQLSLSGKWELVKDVSAFANAGGGLLVLGFKTSKHINEVVETASSYSCIAKRLVDSDAYAQVVGDWVYPSIRGLAMTWFPADPSAHEGILVIEVPAQNERDWPFFVRKSVIGSSGRAVDAWSVHIREGDRCVPLPVERLHADVVTGRSRAHAITAAPALPRDDVAAFDSLLDSTRSGASQELREAPIYALQCVNASGQPLRNFYESVDSARCLLQRPPAIRRFGFNLAHEGAVSVDNGDFVVGWRGTNVRASSDGSFCALAAADENFLGWAVNQSRSGPSDPVLINPLALVEFTYESVRLAFLIADSGGLPRERLSWRVVAIGMKSAGVRLEAGEHHERFGARGEETASGDDWRQPFLGGTSAEGVAFLALAKMYALFGYGGDAIPYTAASAIDVDAITAIG